MSPDLHLVPNPLDPETGDERDTSIDTARLEALKRSRETPLFKGCDDEDAVVEEFLIIPQIHVRVRTTGREKTRQDILKHLVVHVGGLHVEGFMSYAISPAIEVI